MSATEEEGREQPIRSPKPFVEIPKAEKNSMRDQIFPAYSTALLKRAESGSAELVAFDPIDH